MFNNSVMWLSDASLCPLPKPFARPWRAQSPGRPSWRNSWQPWKLTWRKSPRKRREIPTATDSACASESGGTQLRLGGAGREWDAWIWDSMVLWPLPSDFVFFPTGGLFAWEDMAIWKPTLELEPIVLKTDGAWIRIDHKDKGELLIGLACPRQSLNMS